MNSVPKRSTQKYSLATIIVPEKVVVRPALSDPIPCPCPTRLIPKQNPWLIPRSALREKDRSEEECGVSRTLSFATSAVPDRGCTVTPSVVRFGVLVSLPSVLARRESAIVVKKVISIIFSPLASCAKDRIKRAVELRIQAVKGAILAARVGAIGPRAGGVGAVGLAGVDGVVRLVVAMLLVVDAVTVIAGAARVVAVASRAFSVRVGTAVAVVATAHAGATLRVTIGLVTSTKGAVSSALILLILVV